MSRREALKMRGMDYDTDVIAAEFRDEFEYWDKMAEFSIDDRRVFYNFQKVRKILKFLVDYELMKKDVLEIGCGMGFVAKALIASGLVTSYTATECGQKFIDFMANSCTVKVAKAKMNTLPYSDDKFDVAFLFDVLEHIKPEERAQSYAELDRVLKDKRQLFINNPSGRNPSFHNPNFDNPFTFGDIEEFVKRMGCEVRSVKYYKCLGYRDEAKINYYHIMEASNL